MEYNYKETVDWGIIKREWVAEDTEYLIIIEKHEENRYTVDIQHKDINLDYYSYITLNGKMHWGSLEEAQEFAEGQLKKMQQGDYTGCTGEREVRKK